MTEHQITETKSQRQHKNTMLLMIANDNDNRKEKPQQSFVGKNIFYSNKFYAN